LGQLFIPPLVPALDTNANPLSGAQWSFYQTQTTTPAPVYADAALTTSLGAVITANSSGRFQPAYLDPGVTYRAILTNSGGAPLPNGDIDPVNSDIFSAAFDTFIHATDSGAAFKQKWESATHGIVIEAGTYNVPALSTSANGLTIRALGGQVNICKTANGALWTHSGNYGAVHGVTFHGSSGSYSGHNIVLTGQGNQFWNCGSLDAQGRALKSSGYVNIWGSYPSWATADTSSSGYDIEIGTSGTATLYSQLFGIYSSLPTGGILLIDNGSQVISGGQFGKLNISSGTGPAGVNGGMIQGCRILGAVTVGLSSATFASNQFGAVAITFNAGTSGCSMDSSNVYETGCTITNNGNLNNLIERNTLASGVVQIAYGDTTNKRLMTIAPNDASNGWAVDGSFAIPNALSFRAKNNAGTGFLNVAVYSGANDNLTIGDNPTSGSTTVQAGGGGVYSAVSGAAITHTSATSFNPQTDNSISCGLSSQRWNTVYAATGTINTSDGNAKRDVREITEAEMAAAETVKTLLRAYRMKDAVAKKGDAARVHFGVIAQDIEAAFADHGLDAHQYGLFCYDEWQSAEAVIGQRLVRFDTGEDGEYIPIFEDYEIAPAREAGSRYGIRYEELFAFILSSL